MYLRESRPDIVEARLGEVELTSEDSKDVFRWEIKKLHVGWTTVGEAAVDIHRLPAESTQTVERGYAEANHDAHDKEYPHHLPGHPGEFHRCPLVIHRPPSALY